MDNVTIDMDNVPAEGTQETKPLSIKNVSVRIGERIVPLRLTMRGIVQIEDELDMDIEEARTKLNELKKKDTKMMISILRILGNEGLRLKGETADLTDEVIMDSVSPYERDIYRIGALAAVTKGMFMETDNSYEEKQDVVLNEILKKNTVSQADG